MCLADPINTPKVGMLSQPQRVQATDPPTNNTWSSAVESRASLLSMVVAETDRIEGTCLLGRNALRLFSTEWT